MGHLAPDSCTDNWRVAKRKSIIDEAKKSKKSKEDDADAAVAETPEDVALAIDLFAEDFHTRLARVSNGPDSIRNHAAEVNSLDPQKTRETLRKLGLLPLPNRGGRLAELINAITAFDAALMACRGEIADHLRRLNSPE